MKPFEFGRFSRVSSGFGCPSQLIKSILFAVETPDFGGVFFCRCPSGCPFRFLTTLGDCRHAFPDPVRSSSWISESDRTDLGRVGRLGEEDWTKKTGLASLTPIIPDDSDQIPIQRILLLNMVALVGCVQEICGMMFLKKGGLRSSFRSWREVESRGITDIACLCFRQSMVLLVSSPKPNEEPLFGRPKPTASAFIAVSGWRMIPLPPEARTRLCSLWFALRP